MYNLVDAWALQSDLLVICVAEVKESECIVSASFGLYCKFASRTGEGFGQFLCWFVISLHTIIHLEGRCTVEYQRRRDADVARAVRTKIKRS